jgi:hypothetical protein
MGSPDLWNNLAGKPNRYSKAITSKSGKARKYTGLIKLRLAHSAGRSYFVPDALIAVAESRYFLPNFFDPPLIAFNIEDGKHSAQFSVDVGPVKEPEAIRLLITVNSDDRVLVYEDGAQLYRCSIEGPTALARLATGLCHRLSDGDFALEVYHHTTLDSSQKIIAGGELWSSSWNLAGTRELTNVAYGYFTSLSSIKTEDDLRRIAMASSSEIQFQTTSDRLIEEVLTLKVYRSSTTDRTSALLFNVPLRIIAPPHIYLHPLTKRNPAYYEVVGVEIIRVGVKPKTTLKVLGHDIRVAASDIKRFDYLVLGDASSVAGLAAPYDEEETNQIVHLEKLDNGTDAFQFWLAQPEHRSNDGTHF